MRRAASIATVVVTRLAVAAFCLVTALYALLVYLPFSYQNFILPNLVPELSTFAAWHPVLRGLASDRSSLVVCLLSLVPMLAIAAFDILSGRGATARGSDDEGEDRRIFEAAACTAIFVSLTYFAIAAARANAPGTVAPADPVLTLLVALVWSLAAHLVLFGALFLALLAIRGVAGFAGGSAFQRAALACMLAVALATLAVKEIVFAAISFTGPVATAVALAVASSIVGLVAGLAVRLRDRPRSPRWMRILTLPAIAAAAWFLSIQTSTFDWNYLLQKVSAIVIWVAAFGAFHAIRDGVVSKAAILWLLMGAAVPAAAYRALDVVQDRVPGWLGSPVLEVRGVLDAYAGIDPSFKVIYDTVSARASADERVFYDLLQSNTNIPREVRIEPVDVDFVDVLAPRVDRAPNVFIFVIDSLRQDYVSPYNSRVTFTPQIGAFAKDSVVFTRAFTRYGATGLSEPSIWVGGLLVHKQYVLPFAPMNALQKLLAADGFQRFISRDTILQMLLEPDGMDVELDAGVANMDYDLCRSLTDLRSKILDPARPDRPIFAYTQPQNIHISRITREEGGEPGASPYAGFYAPYATRIQAIDACFGQFVQFLRDRQLYDDSVIILTSDHGDSLGEGGRWGHAYTIFPEIVRIPFVVHLPRALQAQVTCDTDAVASLVDITPTLYYLLGHRPVLSDRVLGRPLCTATPQERTATRRDSYMIGSSYGPVYGILRGNGRWLYIADGVNYTDYFYDLSDDPAGSTNRVTPAVRLEYQQMIREELSEVNRFYRPPAPAPRESGVRGGDR